MKPTQPSTPHASAPARPPGVSADAYWNPETGLWEIKMGGFTQDAADPAGYVASMKVQRDDSLRDASV